MWAFYLHVPRLSRLSMHSVIIYSLYMSAAKHSSSSSSPSDWQQKKTNGDTDAAIGSRARMKHAEPHTWCIQSVTGKKKEKEKKNTKIYKIQMRRWYEAMRAMWGEIRRTEPHVKTNCELASSHSAKGGMKEGGWRRVRKRDREERWCH